MNRNKTWETDLIAYLSGVARHPFEPGIMDCAQFVRGAIQAMTGEDVAGSWMDPYDTIEAGLLILRQKGHKDHVDVIASLFDEIPPSFARKGDIGVVPGDPGQALGIVQGHGVYVFSPAGMVIVNRLELVRAFRVK